MPSWTSLLIAVVGSLVAVSAFAAGPLHKCTVDGTVTYQQSPCPSDQVRKTPTLQELNAAEKRKREAAAAAPVTPTAPTAPAAPAAKTAPVSPSGPAGFSCDGRKYCSQMMSCDEAKYFLSNCPGVKMVGDKNGIPCEKQWCSR